MKRIIVASTIGVGVVGIWMLTIGWTHDGHVHSKRQQQKNEKTLQRGEFFPTKPGTNCRGGFCPTKPGFGRFGRGPVRQAGAAKVKPLDLRTLAFRLEYAAQIVSEEIADELPRSRFTAAMLDLAADLQKNAQHFRASVDRGAKPAHLQGDFQKMGRSFVALARPLSDLRRAILIDRALRRTDGLLRQASAQLRVRTSAPVIKSPVPPVKVVPKAEPVTIPTNMKGIALLPANLQAAALAQKTCPVTGGLLGGHGKPLTVDINGKTIFVCCRGCVTDLKANPDQYLKTR